MALKIETGIPIPIGERSKNPKVIELRNAILGLQMSQSVLVATNWLDRKTTKGTIILTLAHIKRHKIPLKISMRTVSEGIRIFRIE